MLAGKEFVATPECINSGALEASSASLMVWARITPGWKGDFRMRLFGLGRSPNVEKMKARRDLPGLVKALGYKKNPAVREAATEALITIGEPAVEPLVSALGSRDSDVSGAAAEALAGIGSARAVDALIGALKSRGMREAARGLGSAGAVRGVEPLIAALRETSMVEAAEALGRIGDARAVEPLVDALTHSGGDVRLAAAMALDKLGWEPGTPAARATYYVAKQQWDRSAELGAPAVEPLINAMRGLGADVRRVAAVTLDKLRWQPGTSDASAAYFLAKGMWGKCAEIGPPAVRPLISALQDQDSAVQGPIIATLSHIGEPAVGPLIAALKDTRFRESDRASMSVALEMIGLQAVEALIAALGDTQATVRFWATSALTEVGRRLQDTGVRSRIAESLMALAEDQKRTVRLAAAEGLKAITGKKTSEHPDDSLEKIQLRRESPERTKLLGEVLLAQAAVKLSRDWASHRRREASEALTSIKFIVPPGS
jgi:HEAT repeat protein